jgi:deoxyribonuclease V
MIFAFDTYYQEKSAKTVCIGFSDWEDEDISFSMNQVTEISNDYVSGEFYKR